MAAEKGEQDLVRSGAKGRGQVTKVVDNAEAKLTASGDDDSGETDDETGRGRDDVMLRGGMKSGDDEEPGGGSGSSGGSGGSGSSGGRTLIAHVERSRSIPARIRRRVFERDGGGCTFVGESGGRCREVERLEVHHLKPFARDGQHHADNLTLRCRAHNALAAERDFGRELILEKRGAVRHESLSVQRRSREHHEI